MPKKTDPDKELLSYLNEAVKLEKSSVKFYTTARNKILNFNMKSLLNAFLTVEVEHLVSVTKVRNAIRDKKKPQAVRAAKSFKLTKPANPFKEMVQLKKLAGRNADIFKLFKGAKELEEKAESFYREAAKNTTHPELKKYFQRFASDEAKHQAFLKKHEDAIYNDGYWLGIDHVRLET